MTRLSDFPKDIQAAATKAYDDYRYGGDYGLVEAIALAISDDRASRFSNTVDMPSGAVMAGLSATQVRVLQVIRAHVVADGVSPSYAEIAEEVGLSSKSGVYRVVQQLIDRGALTMLPHRSRSINIIGRVA